MCHVLVTPLPARRKPDLPPGFVEDHRHCVGEVKAAVSRNHGDADSALHDDTSNAVAVVLYEAWRQVGFATGG